MLSQTQTAIAVDKAEWSFRQFLESKRTKALLGEGLRSGNFQIENNNRSIQMVTPDIAVAYWTHQAIGGNQHALALVCACAQETLQRRLDLAFATVKSEPEYEQETEAKYLYRRFLTSNHGKTLLGKGFNSDALAIEDSN